VTGYDITSLANDRIKRLVRLKERRHRDTEGVFVVEGPRLLRRALGAGLNPVEIYTDGKFTVSGVDSVSVEPGALDKASYRAHADGVIAVFEQFTHDLDTLDVEPGALLLVAEGIEKPGNLGAILRTADAFGAAGVIAVGGGVDVFNPNTLRSSTGAVFTVPVVTTDLEPLVEWLDMPLVGASPEAPTALWDADLSGAVALMVGAEHEGLTAAAQAAADVMVSIPMLGSADSLNASVTMAILAYEALRQRQHSH
jgi:TrmH family RNA methyltransferase